MEEEICKELKDKQIQKTEVTRLKSFLPKEYKSDNGNYNIINIRKKGFWSSLLEFECAKIYIDELKIYVYDEELYAPLKLFGEKYHYNKLHKCWEELLKN